ncbi:hypothetical protein G4B88_022287 [Cannabis sativa]|uniref:MMS19 nucleotide excision repair protein n=1 Tax=Cannabis sativa TaxID=3483 RepID=A0A7J6HV63_CANSA|nr:hypothetical protein G4B88_022287 [Cannabis sativa]
MPIQRSEAKTKTVRKALRDVSNNYGGGRRCSKIMTTTVTKKKVEKEQLPARVQEVEKDGNDDALDRLLLVQTDLTALVNQIDELVVQAFKFKSNDEEGRKEVESFTRVLSEIVSSLKPWVPRFQKVISTGSLETVNQSRNSLASQAVSAVNEIENEVDKSPDNTNENLLISPSPLVSWRADCTIDRGRQMFLVTPLPFSKSMSSMYPDPPKSSLKKVTLDTPVKILPLNSECKAKTHDLHEEVDLKPTPGKITDLVETKTSSTLKGSSDSPQMLLKGNCGAVVMTPCIKRSPPKSCVLLKAIAESSHAGRFEARKSTPFPVGLMNYSDSESSSGSEASEVLAYKYPELLGIQHSYKSAVKKKFLKDSPDWFGSPPKTCVLLEPCDDQVFENNTATAAATTSTNCPLTLPQTGHILNNEMNVTTQGVDSHDVGQQAKTTRLQENLGRNFSLVESTLTWMEPPQSTSKRGKHPGENTLKKELWTKFEAASTSTDKFSLSVRATSRNGFLDLLEEASFDGENNLNNRGRNLYSPTMAEPSDLTQHIESYVDTSRSQSQQAASLDSITLLVKNDFITIETLVREMEMYLTTTDNVIRARGTLLLGEVLRRLASKPLDSAIIHSLIGFFTDRLVDWRALRGALVGCLALLRRKSDVGVVSSTDAKAVAEVFLNTLQVQSLGQHDRELCFQLLECVLECYPNEVASMDELLLYGICEAVDGEKDPHCLLLAFHIICAVIQLFPDPNGQLANFSGELFETLNSYFPIHFTHPKGEDTDVKRDDLARALMIAFSSTPLLEPYVIPLLLEKLSSSLSSSKVDSLKYLSYCSLKYGADRMTKHAGAIWSSIKSEISTSVKEPTEAVTSESINGLGFQENEIAAEALVLLGIVVLQNNDLYLSLILDDEDISSIFNIITSYRRYNDIPLEGKERLHVVGRILYITSKTSIVSCNRVFETFFPRLVGILEGNSSGDHFLNFGALYLSVELLAACRDLIVDFGELASNSFSAHEACCCIIRNCFDSLIQILCPTLVATATEAVHDVDIYFRVKSLQILATFPEGHLPISKSIFESILTTLVSVILVDFKQMLLWKLAMKALVLIGSFISKSNESEKGLSYTNIVVEKIVSSLSNDKFTLPFPLKLEVLSELGATGQNHMLMIVEGLEGAIFANLDDYFVRNFPSNIVFSFEIFGRVLGNKSSAELAIQLLQCYSKKVIPWIREVDGLVEVLLRFIVNIWERVESWMSHSIQLQEKGLLNATTMAMKVTVASCSWELQNTIIQKAYTVLASNTSLLPKKSPLTFIPVELEGLQLTLHADNVSGKDELLLSLFASVIMAIQPRVEIPNIKEILHLFLTTLLKGHVSSAQALGSIINKLGTKSYRAEMSNGFMLEEAIDILLKTRSWNPQDSGALSSGNEMSLAELCLGFVNHRQLQINAIVGLAWVGKGLLLRGHEKVKDVVMILLECILPEGNIWASNLTQDLHPSVQKSAADAFHLLMSDSKICLNRKFHTIIRPLYKQRLFSIVMPILQSSIRKADSSISRYAFIVTHFSITVLSVDP